MVIISIFQSRVENIIKCHNFYTIKELSNQPGEVNIEKKIIYKPTVPYFMTKHNLNTITVIAFSLVLEAQFPMFLLIGVKI